MIIDQRLPCAHDEAPSPVSQEVCVTFQVSRVDTDPDLEQHTVWGRGSWVLLAGGWWSWT
jgi:hypothetical protein